MTAIFYDHLIIVEEIHFVLDDLSVSVEEKQQLLDLFDETMHHTVLTVLLDLLPADKRDTFLQEFIKRPHDPKLLTLLSELGVSNPEKQIHKTVTATKKRLLKKIAPKIK